MADEAFICRQCGRRLTRSDFYVNHKLSVGHEHICKKCESERHKTWLQKSMVIAKRCARCNKLLGTILAYVYTLNLKQWANESSTKDGGTDDDKNLTPGERALKECGFKLLKYTKNDDEICIEYSRYYGDDYHGIVSFTALMVDDFYYEVSVFNEDGAGNLMAVDFNSDLLKATALRLSELNGAE